MPFFEHFQSIENCCNSIGKVFGKVILSFKSRVVNVVIVLIISVVRMSCCEKTERNAVAYFRFIKKYFFTYYKKRERDISTQKFIILCWLFSFHENERSKKKECLTKCSTIKEMWMCQKYDFFSLHCRRRRRHHKNAKIRTGANTIKVIKSLKRQNWS